jgi:hypothetical protein
MKACQEAKIKAPWGIKHLFELFDNFLIQSCYPDLKRKKKKK